ncbi:MAG: hypothetical protein PF441_11200 [Desulfuromusa sp.]|jgi:hypothetical protein|nr:hypothetical protein [Desulfuromusa sp.]
MAKNNCDHPEVHDDFHVCQLTANQSPPDIDKIFENPRYVCTNCGAKVHDARNVCKPEEL